MGGSVGGGGHELVQMGALPGDDIFYAVALSAILMVGVSLIANPMDEEHLKPIFDSIHVGGEPSGD